MPHISSHYINGVKAPSVNQVTGCISNEGLVKWWRKLGFAACDKITKESQERGTEIHGLFEAMLKGQPVPEGHRYYAFVSALQMWNISSGYKFLAIEPHLESKQYAYHGSPDAVGQTKDGVLEVVDFKIKDKEADYRILMNEAAYAQMWLEEKGAKPERFRILNFHPKTAELTEKVYENKPEYFEDFLTCRKMLEVNKKADTYYRTHCMKRYK